MCLINNITLGLLLVEPNDSIEKSRIVGWSATSGTTSISKAMLSRQPEDHYKLTSFTGPQTSLLVL